MSDRFFISCILICILGILSAKRGDFYPHGKNNRGLSAAQPFTYFSKKDNKLYKASSGRLMIQHLKTGLFLSPTSYDRYKNFNNLKGIHPNQRKDYCFSIKSDEL